jgi:hypothetical protein
MSSFSDVARMTRWGLQRLLGDQEAHFGPEVLGAFGS